MSIINNNITDPKAKQIAKEYIDLGLIDFVQNDLLPPFIKYDPKTFEEMSNKIQELENLNLPSLTKRQSSSRSSSRKRTQR